MDMQQLLYFIEVAKEKHMTNAAKKLYISQPALSTSIARLEKELGVPLFIRNRRHIVLSDSGKIFLLFAQNTCEQYRETVERLSALNAERNYTIRFGSSSQRSLSDNDMKITKDGKECLNLPAFKTLVDEGYLPVKDKNLRTWVKWQGGDGYYSDWIVTLTEAKRAPKQETHEEQPHQN